MDVPANINVEKRDRLLSRGLSRKNSQFSSFSLLSMPSFRRGISSPRLYEYDRDVYFSNYDINDELQGQEQKESSEENVNQEEEIFFVPTPLPETIASPGSTTSSDSWAPSNTAPTIVMDMPVGDPSLATPAVTRALIRKYVSEIWNSCNLSYIPEVCSPMIRFNGSSGVFSTIGHEGFADMVRQIHNIFADYHCEIHSMVVENKKAFCRFRFSGKQIGPLLGFPATKQTLSWIGATEFTCVDGKILNVFELSDLDTLKEQLKAYNSMLSGGN